MFNHFLFLGTFAAALGSGLMAGVFFAFSTFVMKALSVLRPEQGIAAMQSINISVFNPWFMGMFMGTGVVCLLLGISSLISWQTPGTPWLLAACALYLFGTVLVTILFNVPRNDALAAVDPGNANSVSHWAEYVASWTAWNHVRTVAAFAAAAFFTVSLCWSRASAAV